MRKIERVKTITGYIASEKCYIPRRHLKIERGIQHIQVQQLKAIKGILETTYEELLE